MHLSAGRTGQEYNQRKKRKGAFWEDRYHATVIEDGEHLLRCIVYIDMNMVRAGVVDHPEQWLHGGYNEIQTPRRKCILINYDTLKQLSGFHDYASFQTAHRRWVNTAITKADRHRESLWTQAIAVGSESFVTTVKNQMHFLAIGRRIRQSKDCCELRDVVIPYNCHFETQKGDIAPENTRFFDENI